MSLHISKRELRRIRSKVIMSVRQQKALGRYLVDQVHRRFLTRGRSSGQAWHERRIKEWGFDNGRAVMFGLSGGLYRSFKYRVEETSEASMSRVTVYTEVPYAKVHQLGTIGAGGVMPTIRPKRAKALFIPITDAAAGSARVTGQKAAYVRHHYDTSKQSGPMRIATKGRRAKSRGGLTPMLRQGKLIDGRLHVQDQDGDWIPGVPDFIFLKKVDVPPRPMLPNAPVEQLGQKKFITDTMQ